jgi:hypothetical protein
MKANPYFLMAGLYVLLAGLVAADAALASFNLVPRFGGLPWLRVHLITLGIVLEVTFGLLPLLVGSRANQPRPKIHWDVWLALNVGLPLLLIGIPLVNGVLIVVGGTLTFVAAAALWRRLYTVRPAEPHIGSLASRPFYLAALTFLLLGVIVGTGLWLGWGEALHMARPKEVHLHANLWGFTSLLFAGLIVDLYPDIAGRKLAWPRSIRPIFWMLTLGALGLVLAPWLGAMVLTGLGLAVLWLGTAWLLANIVVPLAGTHHWRTPGLWHLVTAYAWLAAPVLLGPLVLAGVVQVPGASAEQNAPQALVYGWLLQFAYAVVPYGLRRFLLPEQPAQLGGSWLSLSAVHVGVVLLVLSIFNGERHALLHGAAYAFWAVSLIPTGLELWRVLREGQETKDADPSKVA